jgi:hypothetical protein
MKKHRYSNEFKVTAVKLAGIPLSSVRLLEAIIWRLPGSRT